MANKNNQLPLYLAGLALSGAGALLLGRLLVTVATRYGLKLLMTETYEENLWELASAGRRVGAQNIIEGNLRSTTGKPLARPLGSPRKFIGFDQVTFNIAQLHDLPTPGDVVVDTSCVIGPRAAKPLRLATPLMVSGMAYGIALSAKAKIALARGATLAGAATNTGEGPWLPLERREARHLVLQYNRGGWNRDPAIIRQADMIEIQLGQGAIGGISHIQEAKKIGPELHQGLGIAPGQHAVTHSRLDHMTTPAHLRDVVTNLRQLTGGIPIGAKIGAGNNLEADLDHLLAAGVDVISLDGAQAASTGSPPLLQDDFGLPTLIALCRASKYLKKKGVRDQISLIINGGLFTPGDYLKALAMGANAVYLGSMALFAISHTQVLKALPWEPPTQIVFYNSKYGKHLNVKQAAHSLANFLQSCTLEMAEGIRALGKTALSQVDRKDLMALNQETAQATGLPLAYNPPG